MFATVGCEINAWNCHYNLRASIDHRLEQTMRRLANYIFTLILAAVLMTIWACTQSEQAPSAGPGAAAAVDRTVLPPAEQPFKGKIEVA